MVGPVSFGLIYNYDMTHARAYICFGVHTQTHFYLSILTHGGPYLYVSGTYK